MSENIEAAKIYIIIAAINEAGNIKETIATSQVSKPLFVVGRDLERGL
ncbi:hypothetical protein [Nostoc sp. PA-18-2419]|nr:hypothetical protein [Nostoc sp. PA-18-2419]